MNLSITPLPLLTYYAMLCYAQVSPYFLFPIRMSEQVIKVTTTIELSFSDLTNRLPKKQAIAVWNLISSIAKKRHVRYSVEAQQYDFVRDVIVDAVILEAPINTSDSDSTYSS
jgi:hypothetical protein